jgi:hypothetical protein
MIFCESFQLKIIFLIKTLYSKLVFNLSHQHQETVNYFKRALDISIIIYDHDAITQWQSQFFFRKVKEYKKGIRVVEILISNKTH